ncbi:MAG: PEGA domain-containing protein [Theionarchaea archaeon]|nr:PEGA domain-containing protein [Theionarchaea archaeon]
MKTKMTKVILILFLLTMGFVPVIWAPAPTATTLSATSITSTSAVLRGSINPGGLATQWDFASCDSSSSPTYFSPTPLQNLAAGSSAVTVSYTLTGLLPGMTYKYTVRAVNSAGSQNGSCVTFTTSGGGGATAVLTTNKPDYSLGETVLFTLTNTGGSPFTGTVNNPFTIYKRVGAVWQTAYVPGIAMLNWTLNPGDTKTWSWGQTSNTMVTIDAGTYKVEVDLSGVGTWDTTFTIGMGGGGGGTGSLRIYNNTSDYDIYIDGSYVATALTSTVTLHNISAGVHQVKLTKSGCQDVTETVTIMAGSTTTINVTMNCGGQPSQEDDDGDGVSNSDDSCYNPDCNLVDANGCPKDTDNDGLNDCEDDCPRERGIAANDGCPQEEERDRDSDGVKDDDDACFNPDCNIVDTQGCPKDTDGDGLEDCKDDCPSEYGERQNQGCPSEDADNDGVADGQDNCYNPGCNRVDSRGCPYDSDGDGLNDCEDNCPNQSGTRNNNGCPEPGPSFCLGSLLLSILVFFGILFKN